VQNHNPSPERSFRVCAGSTQPLPAHATPGNLPVEARHCVANEFSPPAKGVLLSFGQAGRRVVGKPMGYA
jgi:hypothetical protein